MYESLSAFKGKNSQEIHQIIKKFSKKDLKYLDKLLVYQEKNKTPKLKEFVIEAWPIVEPGTEFNDGWHIDTICHHLEAVSARIIRNLVINIPPRHMKSLLVSVLWPIWEWLKNPQSKFLFSSYVQKLSTRDSLKCRNLIRSPWFQSKYGDRFQLSKDQNQKTRFENNKSGYRIATSVDATATGEGGNFIVCDDPHSVSESGSDAVNESTLIWWDETMSNRLNDPKRDCKVIVMQPVSERDLSAHVLEQGGYEHLVLPCEYYYTGKKTCIGWEDPRRVEGELLWPSRVGVKEIAEYKLRMGEYAYATQYQMLRAPRGGGMVKNEWWRFFDAVYNEFFKIVSPKFDRIIISMDTAFKEGKMNDYCTLQFWGVNNTGAYLFDSIKRKMDFPTLLSVTKHECIKYPLNALLIEDAASGQSLIQTLKKETRLPVIPVKADSSKESRLSAVSTFIESGRVFILNGANWSKDFMHEVEVFPNAVHDDQVDAMTQALKYIFLKTPPSVIRDISIFGDE